MIIPLSNRNLDCNWNVCLYSDSDADIGFDVCVVRDNGEGVPLPLNGKCQLQCKSFNNQFYIKFFHSLFRV